MRPRLLSIVFVCALVPSTLAAQIDQAITPPANLVLANDNGVPVGPFGGLEGQAIVARVGNPSSAWFNPAGLAQQGGAQISGSAGDQQTVIYGSAAPSAPPSIITRPFPGLTAAADAVVNVGVGGHVRVTKNRPFRIHAGFSTDNSPVAAEDQVFHHVDMLSWTIGSRCST